MSKRKRGITRHRKFQVAERLLETVTTRPREARPAGNVELVGLCVVGRVPAEPMPVVGSEFLHQRGRGTFRNGILDGKDIREVLVEPSSPQLTATIHIDEPHGHPNLFTTPLNRTVQDAVNPQLLSRRDRILVRCAVATNGTERADY